MNDWMCCAGFGDFRGYYSDAVLFTSEISCGVLQLSDLDSKPENIVLDVMKNGDEDGPVAYIIFSDADCEKNGINLAQYIADRGDMGTVYELGPKINPNSGNKIRVWVWDITYPRSR